MKYDVTIGIPVFKSCQFIERALNSALSQSYPSIEFLIVDDAGSDGSIDIIRQIASQHPKGGDIRIISHSQNQGVSASRNHMIAEAKGQYLFFMDSDDEIRKDTIELMMHNAERHDAEMVFGSYEKVEVSGKRQVFQYPSLQLLEPDSMAVYAYRKFGGIQASACNYLIKTSVLRNSGLRFIDSDYWEDLVFTFDLVTYIHRAVLLPDITYSYLCREGSLSHYQERTLISKGEILKNVQTIDHLKNTSSLLYNKVYFPNRCFCIMMADFYIACNILKRRNNIAPSVTNREIKSLMNHPATWNQIQGFKQSRLKNALLFIIGKLPPLLCVGVLWVLGKSKKLL